MVKIAPSVLNADFTCLQNQVNQAVAAGADWIHLDVMDGDFVPNLTFGPMMVQTLRRITDLPLDVHLMMYRVDEFIPQFVEAGANNITVHVEACPHLRRTLETIRRLGASPGVTLNPATPVTMLEPILELVDLVLVMSVEPGFGGQSFIKSSVKRIDWLAEHKEKYSYDYDIEVDGGIDKKTAPVVCNAGATVLVIGTAIFKSDDISQAIGKIRAGIR
jgi:ribulose-phosphate 3-epimerase